MPLFSAGQIQIQSGVAGVGTPNLVNLNHATSVGISYSIPRADVSVLNRGKPLSERPVINYTPVDVSINCYKTNKDLERCLGLVNSNNVISNIIETRNGYSTSGVRDFKVLYAPSSSSNYNSVVRVNSGVLTTYQIQGSVGDPVSASLSFQALEMSAAYVSSARDSTNYSASLVKPENATLTGIQFTGVGLTGVTIQSFSFSLGINRTQILELGSRLPTERPLTDVNAGIQVQGFFEGFNNAVTSLQTYACGQPMDGEVTLSFTPSCTTAETTTINVVRPYFDSFSVEGQAGGFSTFTLSLNAPIGTNPTETTDGSVVKIT
jgi:hypothetical protein